MTDRNCTRLNGLSLRKPLWRYTVLSAVSVLSLAGCSDGNSSGKVTTSSTNSTTTTVSSSETLKPIEGLKPSDTVAPSNTVKPIETIAPIPTAMETFRAMAPEQGLKITPLFNTPVSGDEARIKRVEDAVQGMHNDFDTVMPTIVRMAAMEKDMKSLIAKLHTLTGDQTGEVQAEPDPGVLDGNPMQIAPDMVPDDDNWDGFDDIDALSMASGTTVTKVTETTTTTTTAKTAPDKAIAAAAKTPVTGDVKAVRIGDHPDKTRIVLDMSVKTAPVMTFQNDGKQLVIDLPALNWTPKTEMSFQNSALVSSYRYSDGKLTLTLRKAAQIKAQQSLPPEGASGFRYVIDLAAK